MTVPGAMLGLLLGVVISAMAGDLSSLPTNDKVFSEKIHAFIKSGDHLGDARGLLEAHAFRCNPISAVGKVFQCSRSQGGAMASSEIRFEVWLFFDGDKRIKRLTTEVKVLEGLPDK